ncbi:potassium uptake TrkH family protein [Algoriphagus boseongensis]|uniref:Potassium uptake TrkH family protein n=1 Tax=Algoriphagus boseongensis TaxID=1442587 RepID=A0A4R6T907_9BACT|nr:potassium transporter TrkG [Algoriphagus boseongensis]TDQ19211.1 potassium uptake TrkH family protein [Algoriphagus boseongensis]
MSYEGLFKNPDKKLLALRVLRKANSILRITSTVLIFFFWILDLGFPERTIRELESLVYGIGLLILGQNYFYRILFIYKESSKTRLGFEILLTALLHFFALVQFGWINTTSWPPGLETNLTNVLIFLLFFIDLSRIIVEINKFSIHPALIFILSFLMVILVGTILLKLPNSTTDGISWVDALFTSTSAVCVTGLIVVDTATAFTGLGKTIILFLFQIGGLGMMTFTSFFGFFFKGGNSLQSQLFLKDYINEDNIGQVGSTLIKIIVFTLGLEAIAGVIIYFSINKNLFDSASEQVFFSVFHAVSAFCNAGFSTLSNGLYEEGFRTEYHTHLVLAFAIILGGIGFPVIVAYFQFVKGFFNRWFHVITEKESFFHHAPRMVNINTKLISYTTLILLLVGFVGYWFFEANHSLKGLNGYGKVVTAFFGSVTPRTAGFNTVDMRSLAMPTVLIYLILMWIGASPGSTGGGLKTSTFAVAVLSAFSVAKGKDRVEVFRRQIDYQTVHKANAVIFLSFIVIGSGVFMVLFFNPELAVLDVAFEIFSAFSTVGLSLGITAQLSTGSKLVVSLIMFLGRVGTLTVLVAFIKKARTLRYKYPKEGVFIT